MIGCRGGRMRWGGIWRRSSSDYSELFSDRILVFQMLEVILKLKNIFLLFIGIIVMIAMPYVIWFFVNFNLFPWGFITEDYQDTWIQWTGSIVGGIIGGAFTYLGVRITLYNQRNQSDYENRKNVLPLLKPYASDYDYKYRYVSFDFVFTEESKSRKVRDIANTSKISFELKNVGQRELYDLKIGNISSTFFKENINNKTQSGEDKKNYYNICPIIYKNDSICINFYLKELGFYNNDSRPDLYDSLISPIEFDAYFSDCYDNFYKQSIEVRISHKINKETKDLEPALQVFIERTNVLSAPELLDKNKLPFNEKTANIVQFA